MCCLVTVLAFFSIIAQLLHRLALCPQSCKSCDYAAYVDSCLIECWAPTFLFALIVGVDFIIVLDKGPLPLSPLIQGQEDHQGLVRAYIKIRITAAVSLIQHFLHLPRHFVFTPPFFKQYSWYEILKDQNDNRDEK